jgi:hypothetical protein
MQAQNEWAFALWKGRPTIWSEVAAYSFQNGEWLPANSAEVGTDGVTRAKSLLEAEFGNLTDMPPFPFEEVAKAFQIEEKRLRRM